LANFCALRVWPLRSDASGDDAHHVMTAAGTDGGAPG
jgi:hypothetical protein